MFFENCTVKVVKQRNCLTDIQSKAKGIKAFVTLMKLVSLLMRMNLVKLQRAHGECLGTRSR